MEENNKISNFKQGRTCYYQYGIEIAYCSLNELEPITDCLASNIHSEQTLSFQRGTLIDGHRLDLCKQNIGPDGARMITNALINNTEVKSIMFGADGILNEGAESVSKLLLKNKTIETVFLGCNLIEEEGANALSNALKNNNTVNALWLKRNPIGDKGIEKVADMLKTNHAIKLLDLVNTDITIKGIRQLVEVLLNHNHTLEHLFLGGNNIAYEEIIEIAQLLTKANIKSLSLNTNQIGDKGITYLAEKLINNKKLENLSIASNGIGKIGLKVLCESLMDHTSLKSLNLGYSASTKVLGAKPNYFGKEGLDYICKLLKKNTSLNSLLLMKNDIKASNLNGLIEALESNETITKLSIDIADEAFTVAKNKLIKRNKALNTNQNKEFDQFIHHVQSVYR